MKNGRRIISVVMKSSNDRTRHTDSAALLDYGFALLEYQSPYDDVAYHWCREDVAGLKELGVELHAQEDAFRPDDPVTRAEFTAMLYTALEQKEALPQAPEGLEEPDFTDTADSWAADYIHQAAALGLVNGADANSFAPDRPITRQEIMTILDRCLDLPDENGLGFADDGDIAFWALEAAARTTAAGLFQGGNGNALMPLATSTRAEAAAVLSRVVELL
ncbi:MAG TPA: S-layer homology domain-containing protein [Candidatus Flavonifractor intestinigallinarum]|uniref:S-layer homology domain-containing protein n=2 Tax=Flavonifractor TaxID=946234 RepID=A0A9D2MMG9_9FIRM|nr:S-layer homology domain-containing protein [Candidatus Flavonifractor intestinigallinarum]